jgi:ribosomal protein L11 methylase PrmA
MNDIHALPGSFRDPSGRVYEVNGKIFRTVATTFAAEFEFVESTGLLRRLIADNTLLPFERADANNLPTLFHRDIKHVLQIPRLRFVSYPYEWPFSALKAAALLHLELQLTALEFGVTLRDATAYNIQFQGARPVFIDHLSFRRYRPGEIWPGHRQFCEQFLNPLLLRAFFGVPHNAWYRGTQEGIKAQDLSRILKWRHLLTWNVLAHVVLQSFFQRSVEKDNLKLEKDSLPTNPLSLAAFQRVLKKLHSWISKLTPADMGKTIWQEYSKTHGYSSEEVQCKKRFVSEFVRRETPRLIWDLGCNTGDYCVTALEAGAEYAVGFDYDQGALEIAFARAAEKTLAFQPLFFDAANPSPNQGWQEQERYGLQARSSADAILALAFIHHLTISHNIPLDQMFDWIITLAPRGVVEFVPKSDPMVQSLLRHREDIFSDYTKDTFLNYLDREAKIINTAIVSSSGRLLVSYARRQDARGRKIFENIRDCNSAPAGTIDE